jgi:diguanylate cyclase (GGDEF)-like protein
VHLSDNSTEFLFGLADASEHITDNKIISLAIDKQGVFWLGSNSLGAFSWNPKRNLVKNFRYQRQTENSLSNNVVTYIQQQSNNENILWVGTSNGLNRVNTLTNEVETFLITSDTKSTFTQSDILKIVEDDQHRLWLTTSVGIILFDLQSQQLIDLPFSKEVKERLQPNIYTMELDEQQRLWILDDKSLVSISLLTGKIDELAELNAAFGKNQLWNILGFLPGSNKLLFSTNSSLFHYDTDTREVKKLYEHADTLETEWSFIDSWIIVDNNLWLAFSGKGLVALSLDTYEMTHFFHKGNSIINNNVYGVMADENNHIWFSTHQGIFELNTKSFYLRQFSLKDGFPAMEYNAGAYAKLADKRFVYGSMEGLSIFDPIQLTETENLPEFSVYITDIGVLSRELLHAQVLSDSAVIDLQYDDVGIRIDFSTFTYFNNKNIIFDYKLLGETDVNYPPTRESYITFPTLPSGKHRLEIRARSPLTGVLSKPVHLNLNVSYAPWRSPLAIIFYFIVLSLMAIVWYRYRRAQQQLLLDAHEQVKYRENRLQLALTGSNSEVWDWQADENLMFGKRIALDLGYKEEALFYSFDEHTDLIHPEDHDDFMRCWQLFITNANLNDNFVCTYRLKTLKGQWLWYKDLGKIVAVDVDNSPVRVTGSYTNITESRASEERAQYYGDAFQQTKDWVFIIDEKISRVTANQSMRTVFDWPEEEFDYSANLLGISQKRLSFYYKLMQSLTEGEHWRGEELIIKEHEEYHVIINVTVGRNSVTNALHYLFVLTDISAQKTAESELRLLANYDHLTGLPNRTLLLERIKHAIDLSKRQSQSIALFFIDLDRFKQVNDSLGHDQGDLLLQEIAKRLVYALRIDDTVARIGGDEFVVLLESFDSNNQLGKIAGKIIDTIGKSIELKNNAVSVGASIGVALYPNDADNSGEFLRHADVAMYHAKQAGKNNFQFYTAQMNVEAMERLNKESALKLAVRNDEFINHYQPIVNAYTGKAVGVEMLMRWQTASGIVPPNDFIPLSEELNLIITMTENALQQACKDLQAWHTIRPEFYISINLSVQHFIDGDLVSYIKKLLTHYQLPAKLLRVEVTESALISQPENAITTMRQLSALGVMLALDDFGTGFSSLSYLKQLPLDIIKIDRSFVSGIGVNEADEAIVDTTLVLAKRLNMHCIAEGVETVEQLHYLVAKQCNFIQGYLYSKPIPVDEITALLSLNKTELSVKVS